MSEKELQLTQQSYRAFRIDEEQVKELAVKKKVKAIRRSARRRKAKRIAKRKFLCIARNKRRKSSQRYKGVAKVTSRCAHKGFTLQYNPDSHWSGAFYGYLNLLQFTDGENVININRDNASSFRLDTLFTHKQFSTLTVGGRAVLGTHIDYVNKYKSILQTTNYLLKNHRRIAADLKMLLEKDELQASL